MNSSEDMVENVEFQNVLTEGQPNPQKILDLNKSEYGCTYFAKL